MPSDLFLKGMNTVHRAVLKVTAGRFGWDVANMPVVELTTTGRKSGQPRSSPLLAIPDDGSLIFIGSNFGKPGHPGWSANLKANPEATVHLRGHAFPVTATLLAGDDRAIAWATATKTWPAFDVYAARAGRDIRVFRVNLR